MLLPSSGRLVEAAGVAGGERVVDVGCGTGNTSIAAARAGAHVTGVDLTPKMLASARAAAAREGVIACTFLEGDAQALPLPDDAFDVALSTFGFMFAPDQGGRRRTGRWCARGRDRYRLDPRRAREFLRLVASFAPRPPQRQPPGVG
jgi:SAM-dependent methyltransferase